MILCLGVEVVGTFTIENPIEFELSPFKIKLTFNDELNYWELCASRRIIDYQTIIGDKGCVNPEIPEAILNEYISLFQHVESFGSVDAGIQKIVWDEPTYYWIPEENEEAWSSPRFKKTEFYEPKEELITEDWLRNTLLHRNRYSFLTMPLAFFKEGKNEFHQKRYSNAFINFYFILEGMFAEGQFTSNAHKNGFKNSDIFNYAFIKTIEVFSKKEKHSKTLIEELKFRNKKYDLDGVVHLLVKTRDELSHFSLNNKLPQRNPFEQGKYYTVCFLVMSLCLFSIVRFRLMPFTRTA